MADTKPVDYPTPKLLASEWQTETDRLSGEMFGPISGLLRDHILLTAGNNGRIHSP